MRKAILPVLIVFFLSACNRSENKPLVKDASDSSRATSPVALPMPVQYSGSATIGKSDNVATVMNWNKNILAKNVDAAASYLADSIYILEANGNTFNLTRDSAKTVIKGMMNRIDSLSSQVFTAVPIDVKDKGDEWVVYWSTDHVRLKNGQVEDQRISETYQLVGGKIRQIFQYAGNLPKQ